MGGKFIPYGDNNTAAKLSLVVVVIVCYYPLAGKIQYVPTFVRFCKLKLTPL